MLSVDSVTRMQCYVLHKSGQVAMPCAADIHSEIELVLEITFLFILWEMKALPHYIASLNIYN